MEAVMTKAFRITTDNDDRLTGMRGFLATLMRKTDLDAILIAARLAVKSRIMPALISDPERLTEADPLSPAFAVNAAQQLAKLTRQPAGARLAAVLRPCEIRAFNELVKLNQGRREDVVIVGLDCPGALSNTDFRAFADQHETLDAATGAFWDQALADDPTAGAGSLAHACRACTHPTPEMADIAVELFGSAPGEELTVRALTDAGQTLLTGLDLSPAQSSAPRRKTALDNILAARHAFREQIFAAVADATDSIQGLATYLADCVNCYNCRVACPVCYCTTCVFTTDTFRHEPFQYLQWARRKGGVKMPTDTLFFHLTRLAHMSTACVGCGQCSNACPNDIPLSDLFSAVGHHTQAAFDYQAGLDLAQPPPMSGFKEKEYAEVVGMDTE
jgi:formate dehydrogenase subunit beta